ncbi:MAG TPA: hypothetical protein VGX91_14160 [Candidatus Cybelea sp.]|jgi:hypothetical protein|nr:hypothetical protein [Candidatus Cybelea sp.]
MRASRPRAALIVASLFVATQAPSIAQSAGDPSTLQFNLYAQNRPGETGTATLQQIPGGVKVVITVAGGQNGTQPAHIHTGTCAKRNPVPSYALTNVVHGSSTTTVPGITLSDLLKGQYVLDVHESSADITRFVACAPIAMTK